jgi:phosphoserine aminotransferase
LGIPNTHAILWMQGGARAQFSSIPMHFMQKNKQADYLDTGFWSRMAADEARKYGKIHIVASSKAYDDMDLLPRNAWQFSDAADYFYYTSNETLSGFSVANLLMNVPLPLIADMSSDLLSGGFCLPSYQLIFASTAKVFGVSGATLVIIDKAFLNQSDASNVPMIFDYKACYASNQKILNTPSTFTLYVVYLMSQWYVNQGGVEGIKVLNDCKARLLYEYIDACPFLQNKIPSIYRSKMNVVFSLSCEDQNKQFIRYMLSQGFIGIKGHKGFGGIRVSLYNASTVDQVERFINSMDCFIKENLTG